MLAQLVKLRKAAFSQQIVDGQAAVATKDVFLCGKIPVRAWQATMITRFGRLRRVVRSGPLITIQSEREVRTRWVIESRLSRFWRVFE
jgi:hypothetical protein